MKKSTSSSSSSSSCSPSSTSLDNVIKSSPVNASAGSAANTTGSSTGFSDVDTVISATNSPLWAMRKRRQTPPAAPAENTTMVFNFSNRKEVPDYIDNDGVIFRRKRELPKVSPHFSLFPFFLLKFITRYVLKWTWQWKRFFESD